ncbi:hypothetical protein BUALT_Bualt09G0049400 [Buddleja alternifolia]|uniref:Protein kinase domain-containing protein n=1 Tax=Buddleja alternifolia TaxID=168488 RepID=A0AAV6X033_9LAMI|nr:hypothetical protein BUALT_Bualt09G0049400 [Buddleja alternifolia]
MMILEHHGTMLSPYLPKLMGFCREDTTQRLGVVYDLESVDVLENLFDEEIFRWHRRIKAALGLAKILEHFHGNQPRYLIRDFSTAHVMIGKDHNPVLFNFFGIIGGVIGEKIKGNDLMGWRALGSLRYMDFNIVNSETWKEDMDVYSFGIILTELIRKRINLEDRKQVSKLAMQCGTMFPVKSPNAKEIVEKLNEMRIVKRPPCRRRPPMGARERHCRWLACVL